MKAFAIIRRLQLIACLVYSLALEGQTPLPSIITLNTNTQVDKGATSRIEVLPPGGQILQNQQNQTSTRLYIDKHTPQPASYFSGAFTSSDVRQLDMSLSPGAIEGNHSVDLSGAFNYNIPILTPPGTSGMAPKVSLGYNSNTGDYEVGLGWSISGISLIKRVGKDLFHDNVKSGIEFNASGPYTLDGNRLISTQNNNVFYTESETFSQITYANSQFEVKTKNGLTMTYGGTTQSKLSLTQGTVAWYLTKVSDAFGNYIQYDYLNSDNNILLQEITYTGNTAANITPYNKIKFYYDLRADIQEQYLLGNLIQKKYILSEISVFAETSSTLPIYNYELKYSYGEATYLNEIIFSGRNGEELNSTAFLYGDYTPTSKYFIETLDLPCDADYTSADFNGDGFGDLLVFHYDLNSMANNTSYTDKGIKTYDKWRLYLGTGDFSNGSYSSPNYSQEVVEQFNSFENFNNVALGLSSVKNGFLLENVIGDETPEFVYGKPITGTNYSEIQLYKFNPSTSQLGKITLPYSVPQPPANPTGFMVRNANSSNNETLDLALGDFDGDNLSDLITFWKNNTTNDYEFKFYNFHAGKTQIYDGSSNPLTVNILNSAGNPLSDYSGFSAYDFDGDGKAELIGRRVGAGTSFAVLKITIIDNQLGGYNISLTEIYNETTNTLKHSVSGDFNGDGYVDYMVQLASSTNMLYGTGTSLDGPGLTSGNGNNVNVKNIALDVNGDGKSDIIKFTNSFFPSNLEISVCYGGKITEGFVHLGDLPGFLGSRYTDDNATSADDRNWDGIPGGDPDFYFANCYSIPAYAVGDYNGDGSQDLLLKLTSTGGTVIKIIYFNGLQYKYITDIYDGSDNHTQVAYANLPWMKTGLPGVYTKNTTSPNYPLTNRTYPLNVAGIVEINPGISTPGPVEEYDYHNLITHMEGKGLLGFDKIVKRSYFQAQNIHQLTQEFDLDPTFFVRLPKTSKSEFLSSTIGNKVYFTTTFNASVYGYSNPPSSHFFTETTAISTVNNYLNSTTTESFSYDHSNGNLTSYTKNIGGGKEITSTVYSNFVNAGSWINNTAENISTTVTKANESPFTQYKEFSHNLQNKGELLTAKEGPSNSKSILTTNTYEPNTGVITQQVVSAPNDPSNPSIKTTNFTYDPKYRFAEKTIYDLGYEVNVKYDIATGKVLYSKDPSGLITKFDYDNFGRLKKQTEPDGAQSEYFFEWFSSSNNDPQDPKPVNSSDGLFVLRSEQSDGSKSMTVLDRYGRMLKQESNTFNNGKISSLTTYDSEGRVNKEYGPYLIPLPQGKVVLEKTTNYYDDLGIAANIQLSDGTTNLNSSSTYNFNTATKEVSFVSTTPDGKLTTQLYDETGRLVSLVDNLGNILTYEYHCDGTYITNITKLSGATVLTGKYDLLNNPVEITEPNSGTQLFTTNVYGEILQMVDNKNTQHLYEYDILGRLKKTTVGSDVFNYLYNDAGNGKGQLKEINLGSNSTKYGYNLLGLITQVENNLDGFNYTSKYEYDNLSRLKNITYPNNFKVLYEYANGSLIKIKNGLTNTMVWQLDELDNSGNVRRFTLGNNVQTVNNYDNFGYLVSSQSGNIQDLVYNFSKQNGNLSSVTDNIASITENFLYDGLDRLKNMNIGSTNLPITYDLNGNILTKFDAGTYSYHSSKYNQVVSADNQPNGQISTTQQDVSYNLHDMVTYIAEGNNTADISYGPDGGRYKTELKTNGTPVTKRIYLEGLEENTNQSGDVTKINYVSAPTGLCAMYVTEPNGTKKMYYTYNDHLGSIVAASDNAGVVVARQNFDAWGRRRDPMSYSYLNPASVPTWLYRGYTGHEHLPEFTLINMNGRVYDPILSRMLSPDPVLLDKTNSQDYNKYTYARNNPLKYTDPSGYSPLSNFFGYAIGITPQKIITDLTVGKVLERIGGAESFDEANAKYQATYSQRIPMNGANTGPGKNDVGDWTDNIVYSVRVKNVFHEPSKLRGKFTDAKTDADRNGEGYWSPETEVSTFYMPGGSNGGGEDPPGKSFGQIVRDAERAFDNSVRNFLKPMGNLDKYGAPGGPINQAADFVATFNPLTHIINISKGAVTGSDYKGNTMTASGYGWATVGLIPAAGILGNVGKRIGQISIPVYRVYGGEAYLMGRSWSLINPKFYGGAYRFFGGIPVENTMQFGVTGITKLSNISWIRGAVPIFKQGSFGHFVPEVLLKDPKKVHIIKLGF